MLSLQSPKILSIYASERAARLRHAPVGVRRESLPMEIRRRLGEPLVRTGTWIAPKPIGRDAAEAA